MALDKTKLAVSGVGLGSDAPKMYSYMSPDTKAATIASGYFNGVAKKLEVGDFILVRASDGALVASVAGITVAGVVTVISIALA